MNPCVQDPEAWPSWQLAEAFRAAGMGACASGQEGPQGSTPEGDSQRHLATMTLSAKTLKLVRS
jgi:hypothetical protein